MQPGIRVIRGPDWCYADQDGGTGYLGTVVKLLSNNRVVVVWDIGTEMECRAGSKGAFDLRVYDNAQIGITCTHFCDGCRRHGPPGQCLDGLRWKCLSCHEYNLCINCYNGNRHESKHEFVRYYTQKSKVERVEPRHRSRAIPLVGIFPGAEVVPAEQDDRIGVVKELISLQDSHRGAVTVEWKDKPLKPKKKEEDEELEVPFYRLGADGKVELKLVSPSPEKRKVYIDHLPVLDLSMPVDIEFSVGDRVRIDMNLQIYMALQIEYGGWNDGMEKVMGEEGTIKFIDERRRLATVDFGHATVKAAYLNILTKHYRFSAGDYVRIIDDVEQVKKAQAAHGGWQDSLAFVLGAVGRIKRIDSAGDIFLTVRDHTYVFNQSCLQPLEEEEKRIFLKDDPFGSLPNALSWTPGKVPKEARRMYSPDQSVGIGVRVVRGPDWKPDYENQDGGEGHLGSIVEIGGQKGSDFPKNCVMVQWDDGEKDLYRAGYQGAYDLRIFDNAGIGVKHETTQCAHCRAKDIRGIIWRDSECDDMTLCSECYAADRGDINHHFIRIECPGHKGVKVPKRSMSKQLTVKGIFEQSIVKRGMNWRWENQDGGPDKTGEVIAIVNFSPDTDHDAVEVTWDNGYTNVYRLGYKGRVDIQCVKPVAGGHYYKDHLPLLKLDRGSVQTSEQPKDESSAGTTGGESRLKEGDKVRIEIDREILRAIEKERGSWNESMAECIEETGTVKVAHGEGDITVDFGHAGTWTFSEMSLIKVKEFKPGEIVRVNGNIDTIRKIQDDTVGWNDLMAKVVGLKGRIEGIDEDGDIQVAFGAYTWTFNKECLMEDTGEPDSVTYDEEAEKKSEAEEETITEGKTVNQLFDAIDKSDHVTVERLIKSNPSSSIEKYQGKTAIHWACYKGSLNIVQTLISGSRDLPALLECKDDEDCTPLLSAVKGRQLPIVQMLSELGANKRAENKDKQNAVHLAVDNHDVNMLRFLRDNNFEVNHKDIMQQTPLFNAIMSDTEDVPKIILEWPGLDVKCRDNLGFSPFFIACRKGDKKIVHQMLMVAPEELNSAKTTDGFTGLHIAVLNGKTELVKFLLKEKDIQFDAKAQDGRTPLLVACAEGFIDIAQLLLDKGANVGNVDRSGQNCLHLCVHVQEEQEDLKSDETILKLAELLIKHGVNLGVVYNQKDSSNRTPADLASSTVRHHVQDLLMRSKQEIEQAKQATLNNDYPFGESATLSGTKQSPIGSMFGSQPQGGVGQNRAPFIKTDHRGQVNMSQSMIVTSNRGDAGLSQFNVKRQIGQNVPQLCPSCDEEPPSRILLPCNHAVCMDCAPKPKMKRKVCPECASGVSSITSISDA